MSHTSISTHFIGNGGVGNINYCYHIIGRLDKLIQGKVRQERLISVISHAVVCAVAPPPVITVFCGNNITQKFGLNQHQRGVSDVSFVSLLSVHQIALHHLRRQTIDCSLKR